MTVKRAITDQQRAVVNDIQLNNIDFLDDYEDDFETFDSVQQATDTTHINVNDVMLEQRKQILFDMRDDAKNISEQNAQYKTAEEQKQLRKDFSHVSSCTDQEKMAIITNIISASPEIVFEAVSKYHSLIDRKVVITGNVEASREEMHKQKYDSLIADMLADKTAIEKHLTEFVEFLNL